MSKVLLVIIAPIYAVYVITALTINYARNVISNIKEIDEAIAIAQSNKITCL